MNSSRFYRLVPLFAIAITVVAGLAGSVRPAAAAVNGAPDLSVSLTVSSNPVAARGALNYTLKVYNEPHEQCFDPRGDRCASFGRSVSGVVVDLTAPGDGTIYTGYYWADHGFTCAMLTTARVRCSNGSLATLDTATITLTGYAPSTGGTVTATAQVDPANAISEWIEVNNTAGATFTVNPPIATDLAVTSLTASPNPVARNGNVTFTITVQNVSAREAQGIRVSLKAVPASAALQFVSGGSGSSWGCNAVSGSGFEVNCYNVDAPGCEIICPGSIPAGGSVTFTITAKAITAGAVGVQAEAKVIQDWMGYVDTNAANNSRSLTLTVQ